MGFAGAHSHALFITHSSCHPSHHPFLKQFKEEYKLEDMSAADWWSKIDEIAKENAAKGINLPEVRPLPPSLPPSLFSPFFICLFFHPFLSYGC